MFVYIVQRFDWIDSIECHSEKLFSSKEVADAWVKRQKAREEQLKADLVRMVEIIKEWASKNPHPIDAIQLKVGEGAPSMQAQRALRHRRSEEYADLMNAHVREVWAAEGRTGDPIKLGYTRSEPPEFEITKMEVHDDLPDLEE